MGQQKVLPTDNDEQKRQFIHALLRDMEALEYMLHHDWFEKGITRIGAEQELCLVDRANFKPVPIAMEVIEKMPNCPWLDTELARFNLEINLDPREFVGTCLRDMETENSQKLEQIRSTLGGFNAELILTGILATIRKHDLERHNLTPKVRYQLLIDAMSSQLLGQAFELRMRGIDELLVRHDTPLLEACNTSFQVHLQVSPDDYAQFYNTALALTGPIIAIAANSPIVFGRRLWHESRIALFQQALDVRTTHDHLRERSPRVSFGNSWIEHSVLEIFREDLARFRVLICGNTDEDAIALVAKGKAPRLEALRLHNSTIYRWNRPCYGISPNGQPHLRIENRVIPAGPSSVDQMANTALWLGAMMGYASQVPNLTQRLSWEDARGNFEKAARFGIDSKFSWFGDKKITAADLVLQEILPMARLGLQQQKIDSTDIDNYLGVIEERAKRYMNGAIWQLKAYTKLKKETRADEALPILTAAIIQNQQQNKPVHDWPIPELSEFAGYRPSQLRVEEFMETDLFTVHPDDPIELVAQLMDWKKIRYTPVEDVKGRLLGILTSRLLLRHFARQSPLNEPQQLLVKDVMIADPITISPTATILEAVQTMRDQQIGCLPVVQNDELVGIITEMDFLGITARLIERLES
jgi:CBS domain-containing protein